MDGLSVMIVHGTHFCDVKVNPIPQEKVRKSAVVTPCRIKVSQCLHGTEGDGTTVSSHSLVVLIQKNTS